MLLLRTLAPLLLLLLLLSQLLHLLLQLFSFAAQHLLFPTLTKGFLGSLFPIGQFLLTLGQLSELLHRFVDLLLLLIGGRLLASLVLILFAVEFEIGQVRQVAAGGTAPPCPLRAPGHLNIAERRLGSQHVLQSLLLGR